MDWYNVPILCLYAWVADPVYRVLLYLVKDFAYVAFS